MESTSSEGTSQITLQFNLTRSMDGAAQDVQAAINAAAGTLPTTLPYPPVYAKVNPADAPIVTLALTSDSVPLDMVADAADTLLQPKLSQIDGVGKVTVQGGMRRAIRVRIDPARLAAYNLSMEDIRTAVAAANVNGAKGGFDGRAQAFALATNDQLLTPDAYRQLVISYKDGAPSACGRRQRGRGRGEQPRRLRAERRARRDPGHPAPARRQHRADRGRHPAGAAATGALAAGGRAAAGGDRPHGDDPRLGGGRAVHPAAGHRLVIAVIYLFLGSWRATVIPGVALPLSLIGTFGVMSLLGFALDNLSLMALTVSTGFVVDDAIVMIENVVRYIEQGVPPLQAAYRGAKQIGFTIVSLTVSLVAVFIPLLFMTGVVGRLFNEFAVTLAVSVVVSAVVSLTLTPMMCGRLLRPFDPEHKAGLLTRAFDAGFRRTTAGYRRTLAWALSAQPLVLLIAVATLAGTILLYVVIPKGFLPAQDTGVIVAVTEASQAISIPAMAKLQARFAAIAQADPAVASVASFVGAGSINPTPNSGRLTIALKPRPQRDTVAVVQARLQARRTRSRACPCSPSRCRTSRSAPASAARNTSTRWWTPMRRELATWAPRLLARLQQSPELRNVATDQQDEGLVTTVTVDREAAQRLGVSMQTIQDVLYDSFGQRQISTIFSQANQYRVVLEADPSWQADPARCCGCACPACCPPRGRARPAAPPSRGGAIADPAFRGGDDHPTVGPLAITHEQQFPSVTLSFDLAAGASLGDAVEAVQAAEQELGMPETVERQLCRRRRGVPALARSEPWLIVAAVVVIYIVLGVLYESTIHPVTILSTLPSAGIGALLALMAFGLDLSLVALVGIVLLMGIVKKNAIMMIDFAVEAERERGLTPRRRSRRPACCASARS